MAAKGAQAKVDITKKILATFPGSFVYEKEIRIPYTEDGVDGQIKIVLTAAKNMVSNGEDNKTPGEDNDDTSVLKENTPMEPTKEEKERLQMLLKKLGM